MGRKLTLKKKTKRRDKPVKIRTDFDTAMRGFVVHTENEKQKSVSQKKRMKKHK